MADHAASRRRTATASVGGVPVGSGTSDRRAVDDQHRHRRCRRAPSSRWRRWRAPGRELVRVTVNTDEAARGGARRSSSSSTSSASRVPIIGDFHYNGHLLLTKYPECARALAKYRINPGNVGSGKQHDENFRTMIEVADRERQAGAHRRELGLARPGRCSREMMDENAALAEPQGRARRHAWRRWSRARCDSARAGRGDRPARTTRSSCSAKVSGVQDLIDVYRALAARCDYPLHLGLTEAGMGTKGIVATTAGARASCCRKASATPSASRSRPRPDGDRTEEVQRRAADPAVARDCAASRRR